MTFHAKTYTNGFPLNGRGKRLSNGVRTVNQAVWNGFIERLNGLLSFPNGQPNRLNGSWNFSNGSPKRSNGSWNFSNGLPKCSNGLWNFPNGLPKRSNGLWNFSNGLPKRSNSLWNPPNGLSKRLNSFWNFRLKSFFTRAFSCSWLSLFGIFTVQSKIMHKQELPQKEVFLQLIAGRLSLSPGNRARTSLRWHDIKRCAEFFRSVHKLPFLWHFAWS